jgi:hypothetical protein
MPTERNSTDQSKIAQMLREIEATPSGAIALDLLRRGGYRVRFGRPLGGGAFTYPWRVITLRRSYPFQIAREMLIHELGHVTYASKHGRLLSGSIEQEYEASRFGAEVSRELGGLSEAMGEEWFDGNHDVSRVYRRIQQISLWHRLALPTHQRFGLQDMVWALWQAMASVTWIIPLLRPRRSKGLRDRTPDREKELVSDRPS